MLETHINLKESVQMLQHKDYQVEVRDGFLIIHHVPYLGKDATLKNGTLIMSTATNGGDVIPIDHTAFFIGERPRNIDGTEVQSLVNSERKDHLYDSVMSDLYLSCHLEGRNYHNFYEKVETYYNLISSPALFKDPEGCKKLSANVVPLIGTCSLMYMDTNASKGNFAFLNELYKPLKIAIVGLGGTGSYVLDFIAKTPVMEIHLYDADAFDSHNAFRAPGAASIETLNKSISKVEYFANIYKSMHKNLICHKVKISETNISQLEKMDFIFICVDSAANSLMISRYLSEHEKGFVDSGIELKIINDKLNGMLRVTSGIPGKYDHVKNAIGYYNNEAENVYSTNIQVAELNALAAVLSVIKWKKFLGIYVDVLEELSMVYVLNNNEIINDEKKD